MLNDVHGDRASSALPVLRRVLAAGVTPHAKLTALFAEREALQLKHMLHTLAAELGFARWEACKAAIDQTDGAMLDRYRFDLGAFGDYEKTWFPDEATAREWQREHGGYVVRYGSQAVAILND
ncbi:hypothetical protein [Pandoraea terrae]|nr:hypothetical protein [Pandoraea terrae]